MLAGTIYRAKLKSNTYMKNKPLLLLPFLCLSFSGYSQVEVTVMGVTIGYATTKTLVGDILLGGDVNRFHLGFSLQQGDQVGRQIDERKSNYGLTTDGSGDYFTSVDLGYSRVIKEKFTVHPEVSIGTRKYYTNYVDNRFSGDGYHMIDKKESLLGIGINAGYIVHNNFEFFGGVNSIRGGTFGLRILLHFI